MTSIKVKFLLSASLHNQGTIAYQIIHNQKTRQIRTPYRIRPSEWDENSKQLVLPQTDDRRNAHLGEIRTNIECDMRRFERTVAFFKNSKRKFDIDELKERFSGERSANSFFTFSEKEIERLTSVGKKRIAETYATTLKSFSRFMDGQDVTLDEIDGCMVSSYETYLRNTGVCPNTSSFYMRNLRALFNRAIEQQLTAVRNPFKHVYTGVDKTLKRAIAVEIIVKIKDINLSHKPNLDFARDMFLFSFYTRGMSFIDMAFLRKKDLHSGVLSYYRRKTGQRLFIKWEDCMQKIVDKYDTASSQYLLPIIQDDLMDERKQYIYQAHRVNMNLKSIGRKLNLTIPLTTYVARHSWASIARSRNVPVAVISESMGHDSENTTRIYLASLDNHAIDEANSLVLESVNAK